MYRVFYRTWWAYDDNGRRYPSAGKKTLIATVSCEADARAKCREWNEDNDPGPLSRKAEYEYI